MLDKARWLSAGSKKQQQSKRKANIGYYPRSIDQIRKTEYPLLKGPTRCACKLDASDIPEQRLPTLTTLGLRFTQSRLLQKYHTT